MQQNKGRVVVENGPTCSQFFQRLMVRKLTEPFVLSSPDRSSIFMIITPAEGAYGSVDEHNKATESIVMSKQIRKQYK